jgi:hypothetical protein
MLCFIFMLFDNVKLLTQMIPSSNRRQKRTPLSALDPRNYARHTHAKHDSFGVHLPFWFPLTTHTKKTPPHHLHSFGASLSPFLVMLKRSMALSLVPHETRQHLPAWFAPALSRRYHKARQDFRFVQREPIALPSFVRVGLRAEILLGPWVSLIPPDHTHEIENASSPPTSLGVSLSPFLVLLKRSMALLLVPRETQPTPPSFCGRFAPTLSRLYHKV